MTQPPKATASRTAARMAAVAACSLALSVGAARAEVVDSGPAHFRLRLEARSDDAPAAVWARLIDPSQWWSDDHTYSGDADNLSLDCGAGGLWSETWDGGAVAHGVVLACMEGRLLRLEAPFGPLQELGVAAVWTIGLAPDGEGTAVTFDFVANGGPASGLDALAPAVDAVKGAALRSLVGD